MAKANSRARARIEARIRERAAHCVEFELNDPRGAFITVTGCEVSPDLSIAKILYSVYGSQGDKSRAAHMLEDARGFVRTQIGRVLKTRRIPQVRWVYDDSVERQAQMERRIQDALAHDRDVNPDAHSELVAKPPEEDDEQAVDREYHDFLDAQDEEGL